MVQLKKLEDNVKANEDTYSKAIGEIGRWHWLIFSFVAFPISLVVPSSHLGIIYMAPKTTFRCSDRGNSTEDIVNMTCYSDCERYEYFSEFSNSIIIQWELICDRAWLADFAQTICMFGVLIGSAIFGFVSDRYGRRVCLISAGILQTCTSFMMPFCPDFWSLITVRFLLGSATGGTIMPAMILLMEIFGANKRELLGCMYMLPYALGHLLTSVIAFYFRGWRVFSFAQALPTLVFLTYVFWLPESPKWLISCGELEKAQVVMTSAAKWNKLPHDNMKSVVASIANEEKSDKKPNRKATLKDLVTLPSLRARTLFCFLMWFTSGVTFYGSFQYLGQTSSNVFLSDALVGIAEVPGFLLGAYVSKVFGRRTAIMAICVASGIGNGIMILPDEWYYVRMIAGATGASCAVAVFSLIYVFTSELFPTVARNMGIGTSFTANKIGSMAAPFIGGLRTHSPWIPPIAFALAPLISAAACWCLPETRGRKLEDYLEEDKTTNVKNIA